MNTLTRQEVKAMEAREIYVSSVMERTAIITEDAEWFQAHLRAAFDAGLAHSHEQLREAHGKAREALTLIREGAEAAKGLALLGLNESALSAGEEAP